MSLAGQIRINSTNMSICATEECKSEPAWRINGDRSLAKILCDTCFVKMRKSSGKKCIEDCSPLFTWDKRGRANGCVSRLVTVVPKKEVPGIDPRLVPTAWVWL